MKSYILISSLMLLASAGLAAEPAARSNARIALPYPPALDSSPEISSYSVVESICGSVDDSQNVEAYDGKLGVSRKYVRRHQSYTGQIQWRSDLEARFAGPGDDPGNVSGARWCTGTLISDTHLLTAAHCFRIHEGGWKTPRRNGNAVPPADIAGLMQVNFNYQHKGTSGELHASDTFDVEALVEFGDDRGEVDGELLDYAIIRLKPRNGMAPGKVYGVARLDASAEGRDTATRLAIIQHPEGNPKKVDAGDKIESPRDILLRYADLDTLGGSSGSGILDQDGDLIGVHTNGGCTQWGGFNFGVSLFAVGKVSDLID